MVFGFFKKTEKKDISTLLKDFREKGYRLFGGMENASETLQWGKWVQRVSKKKRAPVSDALIFSRLSLLLAMHDFNFPLGFGRSVDQSFTDGQGDCGLDGIALAIGNTAIYTCDDVCRVIDEEPKAPVRILFHKARLPDNVNAVECSEDIAQFKKDILFWLAEPEAEIVDKQKKSYHASNDTAMAQWRNYNCVLKCFDKIGQDFSPEITILFSADGHWLDQKQSREAIRALEAEILKVYPLAVVRAEIWGKAEIEAAAEYARVAVNRMAHNFNNIKMPTVELPDEWNSVGTKGQPVKVQGYAGFIPAQDLLKIFMKQPVEGQTGVPGLDYRFFRDSPRHYIEINEEEEEETKVLDNWNVGAREIAKSLTGDLAHGALPGQGALIGYGHNGVVIVARKAMLRPGTKEAQVSKIDSLELVAPQVVNGAQTCFVMHKHWDDLRGVFVPLKVIISASYNVKDYIIASSNTQHLVDDWDMFTRRPEIRTYQRRFRQSFQSNEKDIWLQRRRNKPFEEVVDIDRTVLARDLLEASVSCFYGVPHLVQEDPKQFLRRNHGDIRYGRDIFAENHNIKAYRAMAWLLVASKQFRKSLDKDAPMLLRNFHVFALWRLVDPNPDHVDLLSSSEDGRCQKVIDVIWKDLNEDACPLAKQAADIVWQAMAAGHQGEALTQAIIAKTPSMALEL